MKLIPALIVLIIIIFTVNAYADPEPMSIEVDIHGISKHFGGAKNYYYNEKNLGFGLTLTKDRQGITFGSYHNSRGDQSAYAAYTYSTPQWIGYSVGFEAGIVTGYTNTVSPMIVPKLNVHFGPATVKLRYLPAIGGITPAVASLSLGIKIN